MLSPPLRAWNAAGHKLSGIIAYENLSENTRQKIIETVKNHPRFKKDFKMPLKIMLSDEDVQNRWIFMQMAIWPDLARRFNGQTRKDYHRSRWHWINEPVYLTNYDRKFYSDTLPSNRARDYNSGKMYYFNIAQSYQMMTDFIAEGVVTKEKEATFLCWIFHQVGDIHQPLHSSALFNTDKFFYGDKGGNSVYVRNINQNLHSYWDGILGKSDWSYKKLMKTYNQLKKDKLITVESEKAKSNLSINRWIVESNKLARGIVYTPQIMAAIKKSRSTGRTVYIRLDYDYFDEYELNCKKVAQRRIHEAGLRLAAVLEEIYG